MADCICKVCKHPIKDDTIAYQIRYGYIESDDFKPESDYAFFHEECFDDTYDVNVDNDWRLEV